MYLFKTKGKVDGGGNAEWPEGGTLERCQLALPGKEFTEQQVGTGQTRGRAILSGWGSVWG